MWLQLMSLPLRAIIIVSKFASRGRWKLTWIPRYRVPSPAGIHLGLSSPPHSQVLSFLLAQMAADLCQFIFAPDVRQKVLRTSCALSMLAGKPYRYKAVSSANVWSLIRPPLGREKPSTPCLGPPSYSPWHQWRIWRGMGPKGTFALLIGLTGSRVQRLHWPWWQRRPPNIGIRPSSPRCRWSLTWLVPWKETPIRFYWMPSQSPIVAGWNLAHFLLPNPKLLAPWRRYPVSFSPPQSPFDWV